MGTYTAPKPRPYVTRVTHEQTGDVWEVSAIPGSVVAFHDETRRQIDFADRYTAGEACEFIRTGDFVVASHEHVYAWKIRNAAQVEREAREEALAAVMAQLSDDALRRIKEHADACLSDETRERAS